MCIQPKSGKWCHWGKHSPDTDLGPRLRGDVLCRLFWDNDFPSIKNHHIRNFLCANNRGEKHNILLEDHSEERLR